jgi:hypothetical protein
LTAASTGTPSTPEEPRPAPAAAWHQAWQLVTVMTELLDQKEATTHPLDTKINNTVYTADLTTSGDSAPLGRPVSSAGHRLESTIGVVSILISVNPKGGI